MIYLSQLEKEADMLRLTSRYGLGFESYEFASGHSLDNLLPAVGRFARDFRPLYEKGLSFHGPFLDLNPGAFESMVRSATRIRFEECYTAAKLAKAGRIVFHTGFYPEIYRVEWWEKNSIDFWNEFLSDKDGSIRICLENHHDPAPDPIARVLDAVSHPAFRACFDAGHANVWSEMPAETWIRRLGKRICHFHLNNNDGKGDLHNALDNGTLNIPKLLEYALKIAPSADWALEMKDADAAEASLTLLSRLGKAQASSSGARTG